VSDREDLVDVQPAPWVRPELFPAPFFAQQGEARCPAYGLGAQCQRPKGHGGDHAHQGVTPSGQVLSSSWTNVQAFLPGIGGETL
jgi:hypothetical protein